MEEPSKPGEFFSFVEYDPLIHFMNNLNNAVMLTGLHMTLKTLILSFPQAS